MANPIEAKVQVHKFARELTAHKEWVLGLSMTPDGKTLLTGDDKGQVILWDLPAGKEVRRWKTKGWAWGLAIAPDGQSATDLRTHSAGVRFGGPHCTRHRGTCRPARSRST